MESGLGPGIFMDMFSASILFHCLRSDLVCTVV